MIILDTNVISEPLRALAEPRVIAWLNEQETYDLWLTAITAAELQAGVDKLPLGARRNNLQAQISAIIEDEFPDRILPFDLDAAMFYGEIVGLKLALKQKVETLDCQIAAIARANDAKLATRNIKHFLDCGIDLIDPWAT